MIGCTHRDQPILSDSPQFTLGLQRCFRSLCFSSAVASQVSKVCGIRPSDARAPYMSKGTGAPGVNGRSRAGSSRVPSLPHSLPISPQTTLVFSFVFLVRNVLSFFQQSLLILSIPLVPVSWPRLALPFEILGLSGLNECATYRIETTRQCS